MALHKDLAGTDLHPPGAHKTQHENGGSDEISVAGLSGQLADAQPTTIALMSDVSAFAKTVLDDADAAAVRTTIGAASSSHTHALDALSDVDTTGVADGDRLVYDSGTSTWVASPPTDAPVDLHDLNDVDATAPSDGDVLTWASGSSSWGPAAPSGGSGGGGLTLLGTYTGSAAASITAAQRTAAGQSGDLFQSDYKKYKIEFDEITVGTNGLDVLIRAGYGGGASPTIDTGNNYESGLKGRTSSNSDANDSVGPGSAGRMMGGLTTTAGYGFGTASLTVHNPNTSSLRRHITGEICYVNTSPAQIFAVFGMVWTDTTNAMTALQLLPSGGGTITATFRVYGVAN